MPGKPPDPNSGRSKRRGITTLASVPRQEVPAPPEGLLPEIAAAWEAFWTSPLVHNVITTDIPALKRLYGLYDRRERFDRVGMEDPLVGGSTGQQTLNPLLKEVDVIDSKILALEDRFGMSPLARLKLQVTLGDAHRSLAEINARVTANKGPEADEGEEFDPRSIAR